MRSVPRKWIGIDSVEERPGAATVNCLRSTVAAMGQVDIGQPFGGMSTKSIGRVGRRNLAMASAWPLEPVYFVKDNRHLGLNSVSSA